MKQLIILRGPSGSGKSTTARQMIAKTNGTQFTVQQFEADDYFMKIGNGKYAFNAVLLGEAHGNCQDRVRVAMFCEVSHVIVSNTNMRKRDMDPYIALAEEFGYDVVIYRTKGPWDAKLFASRNVHGLTEAMIQNQINKYQPTENETEYDG